MGSLTKTRGGARSFVARLHNPEQLGGHAEALGYPERAQACECSGTRLLDEHGSCIHCSKYPPEVIENTWK